ncbi:MAG: type III-B CRISPR module RAMP protein Cmr6 [Acidobacteria bacterium]|nr:type III-B CRISPR module RAMP protein Cmr6 [Acidobacteriota bacterium]
MPLGLVQFRMKEVTDREKKKHVRTPYISGTHLEIVPQSLRQSGWGTFQFADLADDLDVEYEIQNGQPRNVRRYAAVPEPIRRLLDSADCRHPGLVLDKFIYRCADQSFVRGALQKLIETRSPLDQEYPALLARWLQSLDALPNASQFRCTTAGPMTLHLARASALENAGICLHPLYGFVYLPGTGLKGMARAFAETIWLPAQDDKKTAWRTIEDVFGWALSKDRQEQLRDIQHPAEARHQDETDPQSPELKTSSGAIVFHDAWPEKPPELLLDIVNNHHRDYYQATDGDNECAPGDWETPNMVSFLAIGAENTFVFVVSAWRQDTDPQLVGLAREWLTGALCHLGAGSKTAAGYGSFKPAAGNPPALLSPCLAQFETELELVTPAFLAGANQQKDDCDLRPATLRGLLRWWWRTTHAGFVDTCTLRRMEAPVWGDTNGGGPVRITLDLVSPIGPRECPGKGVGKNKKGLAILQPDEDFLAKNGITLAKKFTTQGLLYAAYGTDEMKTGDLTSRKRRWFLDAGSQWRIRLTVRPGIYEERNASGKIIRRVEIPSNLLLTQAKAALALLVRSGGVGSKSRKGFGSFADTAELAEANLDWIKQAAQKFRCEWQNLKLPFAAGRSDSLSLEHVEQFEIATPWHKPWRALDEVGASLQAFAQSSQGTAHGKHCSEKAALGLPRKIHGPLPFKLPHQTSHTRPEELQSPKGGRYASPVIFHFAKQTHGQLIVRVSVFTAPHLWDHRLSETGGRTISAKVLRELVEHLRADFATRTGGSRPAEPRMPSVPKPTAKPINKGQNRSGMLKRKDDTWIAIFDEREAVISNPDRVPEDTGDGATAEFFIQEASKKRIRARFERLC